MRNWFNHEIPNKASILSTTIWINAATIIASPNLIQGIAHGLTGTMFFLGSDYIAYKIRTKGVSE